MKDNYDFSKGEKNPYASKLKNGYTVTVHYDFSRSEDVEEQAKEKEVSDNPHSCEQMVNLIQRAD